MDCERQTEDFRGEGVGEGDSLVMGSREGTYCMVHWVLLEVTLALWNLGQESSCFGTMSETRCTQHKETKFGQQQLPKKCLLPG